MTYTTTSTLSSGATTSATLTSSNLDDVDFISYKGQLREIVRDEKKQNERIAQLSDEQKEKLILTPSGTENDVVNAVLELKALIESADYIAIDFELTGVIFNEVEFPNGFEDCKESVKQNSIVQLGLMLMKRSESGRLVQENNGKSVWRIPVCLNDNTDDSIWQKKSLDYLVKNNFDLTAWKVQSLEYSQLDVVWKALLKKPLITHNGLIDILHLLKAAHLDAEIREKIHTIDEFKLYLDKAGMSVYDTKILYKRELPGRNLEDMSKERLPREIISEGFLHDASFDAFCTGHLCRLSAHFLTSFIIEGKNELPETKRMTPSSSAESASSYSASPTNASVPKPNPYLNLHPPRPASQVNIVPQVPQPENSDPNDNSSTENHHPQEQHYQYPSYYSYPPGYYIPCPSDYHNPQEYIDSRYSVPTYPQNPQGHFIPNPNYSGSASQPYTDESGTTHYPYEYYEDDEDDDDNEDDEDE